MKVLITGGTNGMGKGVAKALAAHPGEANEIIILCRSEALGIKTVDELKAESPRAALSLVICDLADMNSVKKAALDIKNRHDRLDAVFINAGIGYASRRIETIDGMDSHFQVNYLSQFYLVMQLLAPLERSTRGGRVIFNATPGGEIDWDDMQMVRSWDYEDAIRQAMTAKRMLLISLHELYKDKPNKISFIGFSIPKTVWTNQINLIPSSMRIMATIMKAFGQFISIERCGEIMAPLFLESRTESMDKSGKLLSWKCRRFVTVKENAADQDPAARERLFDYSIGLCKGIGIL